MIDYEGEALLMETLREAIENRESIYITLDEVKYIYGILKRAPQLQKESGNEKK